MTFQIFGLTNIILTLLFCQCMAQSSQPAASTADITALNAIALAAQLDTDTVQGWVTGDPCIDKWDGIFCSNETGAIKQLNLGFRDLKGVIAPELGDLVELERVVIEENELTGSIPTTIGKLTKLQILYLGNNMLTGALPTQLGQLKDLQKLTLTGNNFDGQLPTQLGNLKLIDALKLQGNSLTGTIPTEIATMTSLKSLTLTDNSITGTIPTELASAPALKFIELENNNLIGQIPDFTQAFKLRISSFKVGGNTGLGCFFPDFMLNPAFTFSLDGINFLCPLPESASQGVTCKTTDIDAISPTTEVYREDETEITLTVSGVQTECPIEVRLVVSENPIDPDTYPAIETIINPDPQDITDTTIKFKIPAQAETNNGRPQSVQLWAKGKKIGGKAATVVVVARCPETANGVCDGTGTCNKNTGECTCLPTNFGDDCSEECPYTCNGKGECYFLGSIPACRCETGFLGLECTITSCEDPTCSGNGVCDKSVGACVCSKPYSGENCADRPPCETAYDPAKKITSCEHGTCTWPLGSTYSYCACDEEWYGVNCDEQEESDLTVLFIILIVVAVVFVVILVLVILKVSFMPSDDK